MTDTNITLNFYFTKRALDDLVAILFVCVMLQMFDSCVVTMCSHSLWSRHCNHMIWEHIVTMMIWLQPLFLCDNRIDQKYHLGNHMVTTQSLFTYYNITAHYPLISTLFGSHMRFEKR